MKDNFREVLNSTAGIYWAMKPYRKEGIIEDQHWCFMLICLKRIEKAIREMSERLETN